MRNIPYSKIAPKHHLLPYNIMQFNQKIVIGDKNECYDNL